MLYVTSRKPPLKGQSPSSFFPLERLYLEHKCDGWSPSRHLRQWSDFENRSHREMEPETPRKHHTGPKPVYFLTSVEIDCECPDCLLGEQALQHHRYDFVVQLLRCVRLFATPCTATWQASLSFSISWRLLKLMSVESMISSNHLILCHPLLFLPSIFPSIRVFSNKLAFHIRWPKHWSFSFSISPSSEHSGLISFRMDWLDLLAVGETLKSLLQHHSSKTSIVTQPSLWSNSYNTRLLEKIR